MNLRYLLNSVPGAAWLINRKLTFYLLEKALSKTGLNLQYTPQPHLLYICASCLPYHISGYTMRTQALLRALEVEKINVSVLTRTGYPWDRKDALALPEGDSTIEDNIEYKHSRTPSNHRLLINYAFEAAKIIEREARKVKAARIHAASNYVNAIPALLAANNLNIPFQYEMRGLWELSRASRFPDYSGSPGWRLGLDLEGFVARHADKLFVISTELGRFAHEHWQIPQEKIKLLPNCMLDCKLSPTQTDFNLIGYAGSLIAYEGLDTLIEAMAIIKDVNKRVRLHIIGEGEARSKLEDLTKSLNLEDNVKFFGRLSPEGARKKLSECGLVCLPRRPYAVSRLIPPIKLAEAMSLGKAIVASDLPVFRDELKPLDDKYFFQAGNPVHLARTLLKILASPHEISLTGKMLHKYALENRKWRYFIKEILPEAHYR